MAVFTPLQPSDAARVATAHGLPPGLSVTPIAAGSVNSNFFLEGPEGGWFFRIYEEQDREGVAYEWRLLDHLRHAGLAVPHRVPGPEPGEVRVGGKPVAVFEVVGGVESCQAGVTPARAREVGKFLARAHQAAQDFPQRRAGRFRPEDLEQRLATIERAQRPELAATLELIRSGLRRVSDDWPPELPTGVIHGDLFRDNVRWEDDRVCAVIDWESASDGAYVYDLAVTTLAWCYGEHLNADLTTAMVAGYNSVRSLSPAEEQSLSLAQVAAAARFATTRITDYYLRDNVVGERVYKDYRRFADRLEAVLQLV